MLDLGCGSGVLAIAVAKSAARGADIIATDMDPQSVKVAAENMRLNGVANRIATAVAAGVDHTWLRQSPPFDLLIANILAGPLIRLAPSLARKVAPGGTLLLSGILIPQAPQVIAAYLRVRFPHRASRSHRRLVDIDPAAALKEAHVPNFRSLIRSRSTSPSGSKLLRAWMTKSKIDAVLVPRADEHQGEYVPACAERLQWLTGFTGSAGIAIAGRKSAALFIDGRYTVQAKAETDTSAFEVSLLPRPRIWPNG